MTSIVRALLTIIGLVAAWAILPPGLDLRATGGNPPPAATTPAEPVECSDFVADLPPCGACEAFIDGKPAARTVADGTVVERLGDLKYDPPGCDPAKAVRP